MHRDRQALGSCLGNVLLVSELCVQHHPQHLGGVLRLHSLSINHEAALAAPGTPEIEAERSQALRSQRLADGHHHIIGHRAAIQGMGMAYYHCREMACTFG